MTDHINRACIVAMRRRSCGGCGMQALKGPAILAWSLCGPRQVMHPSLWEACVPNINPAFLPFFLQIGIRQFYAALVSPSFGEVCRG